MCAADPGDPLVLMLTEDILCVVLILQWQHMGELIFFVHKVQTVWDYRMIFETILSDGKHDLNHVLDPLIDSRLMEDISETLKYS